MQSLWRRHLNTPFDIAIVGSGFAGSLMAMIAKRLGRSVILIEQGHHPRFAIGESSTPLANLLIEQLANEHDLPQVASLRNWGSWQRGHADLAVGLKRGFSFFHHSLDKYFAARSDRGDQMLVAASPHAGIADTHWYRSEFDHYLVRQAQALGVEYRDGTQLCGFEQGEGDVTLHAAHEGQKQQYSARFVIDASGPRGFLHRSLCLPEPRSDHLPGRRAFFTHFCGVRRWDELSIDGSNATPPFPVDDAAVHHVFDGGWIWILRFNNGVTSAGAVVTDDLAVRLGLGEGAQAWQELLRRLPSVAAQFAGASAQREFVHAGNAGFRSGRCSGRLWAMLPSATGFVDPLLSSGFPLTLLGIQRLAAAIGRDWDSPRFAGALAEYEKQTFGDLAATEILIAALYAAMGDFPLFASLLRLYFAAASFGETVRRLGTPDRAGGYLMHDHPQFGPRLHEICLQVAGGLGGIDRQDLMRQVNAAIEPIDVAGLGVPGRRNWFPVEAADLLGASSKLGVSPEAIERLLQQTGFHA